MKTTVKRIALAAFAASVLGLAACGGGGGGGGGGGCGSSCGGGGGGGGHVWTHGEIAREFVRRLNNEIAGFDLELVKTYTLQDGYIVVYDRDYWSYDAYYVGSFHVGDDISYYFNSYEDWFYYDLVKEWGNYFYDPISGVRFEKTEATGKNLAKMQALKEHLWVNRAAENLRAKYGLSAEKSVTTARFAYKLNNSAEGTYNVSDYDAFAKELTGSTISEFQEDFTSGNLTKLADRINTAADVTGIGIEGVNGLINEIFLK